MHTTYTCIHICVYMYIYVIAYINTYSTYIEIQRYIQMDMSRAHVYIYIYIHIYIYIYLPRVAGLHFERQVVGDRRVRACLLLLLIGIIIAIISNASLFVANKHTYDS